MSNRGASTRGDNFLRVLKGALPAAGKQLLSSFFHDFNKYLGVAGFLVQPLWSGMHDKGVLLHYWRWWGGGRGV